MFPVDIQDFASLSNNNSNQGGRWFFTITAPSDDLGKLLDTRKDNTLRWLCCVKTVEDQKFPYLQGGLIFMECENNQT
jgi:hypothetical protein